MCSGGGACTLTGAWLRRPWSPWMPQCVRPPSRSSQSWRSWRGDDTSGRSFRRLWETSSPGPTGEVTAAAAAEAAAVAGTTVAAAAVVPAAATAAVAVAPPPIKENPWQRGGCEGAGAFRLPPRKPHSDLALTYTGKCSRLPGWTAKWQIKVKCITLDSSVAPRVDNNYTPPHPASRA